MNRRGKTKLAIMGAFYLAFWKNEKHMFVFMCPHNFRRAWKFIKLCAHAFPHDIEKRKELGEYTVNLTNRGTITVKLLGNQNEGS